MARTEAPRVVIPSNHAMVLRAVPTMGGRHTRHVGVVLFISGEILAHRAAVDACLLLERVGDSPARSRRDVAALRTVVARAIVGRLDCVIILTVFRRLLSFCRCLTLERDKKSGKVYYCGAERLCQLYPVMSTKKYKPAMKAELMEGEFG